MSERITTDFSLRKVSELPEFVEFSECIADREGPGSVMADMTFVQFAAIGNWNPQSICDGYNRLVQIRRTGKRIYYPLWSEEDAAEEPALKERYLVHFAAEEKAPFVIVCAGGGYLGCASMIEAYPTCCHLNQQGYHAFVLNYRCGVNAAAPNPLDDMACAVSYIMEHAQELGVETQNYAIAGFSAGGHLAACFGTEAVGWKKYGLPRPAVCFLAYPVITMGEKSHDSSRQMFLGEENIKNTELIKQYSAEKQVTEDYPATFIWQCDRDNTVPIENSQYFVNALKECHVLYKYETFDSDFHGWGAGDGSLAEGWIERAVKFWEEVRQ